MPSLSSREVKIKETSSVSVVIPCRNEEKYIGKCLDSLVNSNFPKDQLEVFVVDGMSDDNTRQVLSEYENKFPFIRMLSNKKRVTPVAMNMGIKEATGEFLIILSSHSEVDPDFLKMNMEGFNNHDADCVGGTLVTLPSNSSPMAESIAAGIAHPFGVGNSHFRIGSSEARYVDTVPFGCYRRKVLESIGMFDEDLVRNQDDELNLRLLKKGGKILLLPDIKSYYHARDTLSKLWNMYFQYGHFKPLVAKKVGGVLTWRQLVPAIFVSSLVSLGLLSFVNSIFMVMLAAIVVLYFGGCLYFTSSIAQKKGWRNALLMPAVFGTLHLSYGFGYLKGIWDFVILRKQKKSKIGDVPLTR